MSVVLRSSLEFTPSEVPPEKLKPALLPLSELALALNLQALGWSWLAQNKLELILALRFLLPPTLSILP